MKSKIIFLEPFTEKDIDEDLKIIVKIGSGIDNIDLEACRKHGVIVCNTPNQPSNAVAELTICQMINCLRRVYTASLNINLWDRTEKRELKYQNIGIIGMGRIGQIVRRMLIGFMCPKVFYNDIFEPENLHGDNYQEKDWILKNCDVITLHIPLKDEQIDNTNYIAKKDFDKMKKDVCLLNMSRGGIINQDDLYYWLLHNDDATCAIDSFTVEPYQGSLLNLESCYCTPHIGSCTVDNHKKMIEEARNIIGSYERIGTVWNRII